MMISTIIPELKDTNIGAISINFNKTITDDWYKFEDILGDVYCFYVPKHVLEKNGDKLIKCSTIFNPLSNNYCLVNKIISKETLSSSNVSKNFTENEKIALTMILISLEKEGLKEFSGGSERLKPTQPKLEP